MIYISHLIEDEKMKALTARTGAGIESIEFSVAENLDDFEGTMRNYKKRLEYMNCQELILHGPFLDLNPMAYDSLVVKATQTRYEQAYRGAKELWSQEADPAQWFYSFCLFPYRMGSENGGFL